MPPTNPLQYLDKSERLRLFHEQRAELHAALAEGLDESEWQQVEDGLRRSMNVENAGRAAENDTNAPAADGRDQSFAAKAATKGSDGSGGASNFDEAGNDGLEPGGSSSARDDSGSADLPSYASDAGDGGLGGDVSPPPPPPRWNPETQSWERYSEWTTNGWTPVPDPPFQNSRWNEQKGEWEQCPDPLEDDMCVQLDEAPPEAEEDEGKDSDPQECGLACTAIAWGYGLGKWASGMWGTISDAMEGIDWSTVGHTALDVGGLIEPFGIGIASDATNTAWYIAEEEWLDAALSGISMIPVVGDIIGKGAKYAMKVGGAALEYWLKTIERLGGIKAIREWVSKHFGEHAKKMMDAFEEFYEKAKAKMRDERGSIDFRKWETEPTGTLGGKPTGKPATWTEADDAATAFGRRMENDAADALASAGYRVEQQPFGERGVDYLIEGKPFDCYSPKSTTSARNILDAIEKKLATQTDRIVLNMSESSVSLRELAEMVRNHPPLNDLKEIIVVRGGTVFQLFP